MALICILALLVFSVMGIFSAKYRRYASEAMHCFRNTILLRKCDSKLDEKIKAEIVSLLLPRSKILAKLVRNHFSLLSSLFTILFFASAIYSFYSLYNLLIYGNCNGNHGGYCPLTPIIEFNPWHITEKGQVFGNPNSSIVVYEFGCYSCPYTAEAEKDVMKLYSEYGGRVKFVYKTFPLSTHPYSYESAIASWCAYEQGMEKYLEYRKVLFEKREVWIKNGDFVSLAQGILNISQFENCINSEKYNSIVDEIIKEGKKVGISATPTFIIGGQKFVGNGKYEMMKDKIESELKVFE